MARRKKKVVRKKKVKASAEPAAPPSTLKRAKVIAALTERLDQAETDEEIQNLEARLERARG